MQSDDDKKKLTRRGALKILGGAAAAAGAATGCGPAYNDWLQGFVQEHYQRMTPDEVTDTLARLERKYAKTSGKEVHVKGTQALDGVLYGYALDISRCQGFGECVRACREENNLGEDFSYIKVLELDKGAGVDTANADRDYAKHRETVPAPGKMYMPVSCMQCDNPPCVNACPVEATWREKDGIVVIDYDWCIGCRYCQAACPYEARHFNWSDPKAELTQTETHYLGNRPRPRGVVEKCTFCVQRTREGRLPACQEACPTGARVFGNLLDPNSEIRAVLATKTVFRLKEDLGTEPKFWYFT
jgi:Fe-S-cluster-containing dehydrogenase component